MKKLTFIFLSLILFSCSSDEDNNKEPETPKFAMTAKINGVTFETNNPYGNNEFSSTNIWDYFPKKDFVMLQGRKGILGTPEINIWLKRSDIKIGTYQIGKDTFTTTPSHFINLNDSSNKESAITKEGTIVITEVNDTFKIVKGTFEFKTVDDISNSSSPVNFTITEGTFNYKFE